MERSGGRWEEGYASGKEKEVVDRRAKRVKKGQSEGIGLMEWPEEEETDITSRESTKKRNGYCGLYYGAHKTPRMLEARGPKVDLALRLPVPTYMKATCILCNFTSTALRSLHSFSDISITPSHLFKNPSGS